MCRIELDLRLFARKIHACPDPGEGDQCFLHTTNARDTAHPFDWDEGVGEIRGSYAGGAHVIPFQH
jgi:hypothetical protein